MVVADEYTVPIDMVSVPKLTMHLAVEIADNLILGEIPCHDWPAFKSQCLKARDQFRPRQR